MTKENIEEVEETEEEKFVRDIDSDDWEFLAEIVDKNPDFCKWLGYTSTVWLKRIEQGRYNKIWEKDGKKGLIVIGGINTWDECLSSRKGGLDVQIKLYYYALPSNEEIELQYLQELGEQLISPLRKNGLKAEVEIIGVDGKEEQKEEVKGGQSTDSSDNVKTKTKSSKAKQSGSKTNSTKHNKNTSNEPVPA